MFRRIVFPLLLIIAPAAAATPYLEELETSFLQVPQTIVWDEQNSVHVERTEGPHYHVDMDVIHESMAIHWHLCIGHTGFGPCEEQNLQVFPTVRSIRHWGRDRLGIVANEFHGQSFQLVDIASSEIIRRWCGSNLSVAPSQPLPAYSTSLDQTGAVYVGDHMVYPGFRDIIGHEAAHIGREVVGELPKSVRLQRALWVRSRLLAGPTWVDGETVRFAVEERATRIGGAGQRALRQWDIAVRGVTPENLATAVQVASGHVVNDQGCVFDDLPTQTLEFGPVVMTRRMLSSAEAQCATQEIRAALRSEFP